MHQGAEGFGPLVRDLLEKRHPLLGRLWYFCRCLTPIEASTIRPRDDNLASVDFLPLAPFARRRSVQVCKAISSVPRISGRALCGSTDSCNTRRHPCADRCLGKRMGLVEERLAAAAQCTVRLCPKAAREVGALHGPFRRGRWLERASASRRNQQARSLWRRYRLQNARSRWIRKPRRS